MATFTVFQPSSTIIINSTERSATAKTNHSVGASELPEISTIAQIDTDPTKNLAETVFAVPELLEMILLKVPDMRTVLHAQRVSKTFQATMRGSAPILRKLWLLPQKDSHTITADDKQAVKSMRINPLLLDHRRKLFMRNLILWRDSLLNSKKTIIVDIHHPSLQQAVYLSKQAGSWRDMFVVQPHCDEIMWSVGQCRDLRTGGNGKDCKTVEIKLVLSGGGPPTLGELVDALVEKFDDGTVLG